MWLYSYNTLITNYLIEKLLNYITLRNHLYTQSSNWYHLVQMWWTGLSTSCSSKLTPHSKRGFDPSATMASFLCAWMFKYIFMLYVYLKILYDMYIISAYIIYTNIHNAPKSQAGALLKLGKVYPHHLPPFRQPQEHRNTSTSHDKDGCPTPHNWQRQPGLPGSKWLIHPQWVFVSTKWGYVDH